MSKKSYITAVAIIVIILGSFLALEGFRISKEANDSSVPIEWRPSSMLPARYFVSQSYTWYSLQNNTISCMGNPLPKADVSTFAASSLDGYGKDKNHVYWCTQIVADADPSTFTILSKEYAKDRANVYLVGGSKITDADPATFAPVRYLSADAFEPLQTGYGKDINYVYNLDHKLPNADPATFTLDPVPSDKNWIYLNDKIVGPISLIVDNVQYSKALPPACNKSGTETIFLQIFPPAFSTDEQVIGYPNDFSICVIDKKASIVQIFPYGTQQGVSISKDGSKILYYKYQKGYGEGEQTCADCGQYSYTRATGKIESLR